MGTFFTIPHELNKPKMTYLLNYIYNILNIKQFLQFTYRKIQKINEVFKEEMDTFAVYHAVRWNALLNSGIKYNRHWITYEQQLKENTQWLKSAKVVASKADKPICNKTTTDDKHQC